MAEIQVDDVGGSGGAYDALDDEEGGGGLMVGVGMSGSLPEGSNCRSQDQEEGQEEKGDFRRR